jgi:glycine/D-amino acid oxidase-like deaminating enzyme
MNTQPIDVLVIGAGIIGLASAYYLKKSNPKLTVTVIEQYHPMAFTSAQSGENYRNWWPHPTMKLFVERSIQLMEELSIQTDDLINMNRRGYLLSTRKNDISEMIESLYKSFDDKTGQYFRHHLTEKHSKYEPTLSENWQDAPEGVDILQNTNLIRKHFPKFDRSVKNIIHIRKAGMLDSQQMATYMMESFKAAGGKRITGKVIAIDKKSHFEVSLSKSIATKEMIEHKIRAKKIVNAAGPFASSIAEMLGMALPVDNILQQKIAFPDTLKAIPRNQPFAIDLDSQYIDWDKDEVKELAEDPTYVWLTEEFPGAIHCRPEGGDHGNWVKLGWAYNTSAVSALTQPVLDDNYPEIVLRGAARLNPALKGYYTGLPRNMVHYGGYYTTTKENWPLIGKTEVDDFYINSAMSGFGTMAACASGELCAQWALDLERPDYANDLSLQRYENKKFLSELRLFDTGML